MDSFNNGFTWQWQWFHLTVVSLNNGLTWQWFHLKHIVGLDIIEKKQSLVDMLTGKWSADSTQAFQPEKRSFSKEILLTFESHPSTDNGNYSEEKLTLKETTKARGHQSRTSGRSIFGTSCRDSWRGPSDVCILWSGYINKFNVYLSARTK